MNSVLPRHMALAVMVLVIGAAHKLRIACFEHPKLGAAGYQRLYLWQQAHDDTEEALKAKRPSTT